MDSHNGEFDEFRQRMRDQVPPAVYLPVADAGSGQTYEVEMRPTNDGRVALLAYTALDRLADCCGPHQPWVLYPTDRLEELGQSQPYDVIYLDMPIPEEFRLHGPEEGEGVALDRTEESDG